MVKIDGVVLVNCGIRCVMLFVDVLVILVCLPTSDLVSVGTRILWQMSLTGPLLQRMDLKNHTGVTRYDSLGTARWV